MKLTNRKAVHEIIQTSLYSSSSYALCSLHLPSFASEVVHCEQDILLPNALIPCDTTPAPFHRRPSARDFIIGGSVTRSDCFEGH